MCSARCICSFLIAIGATSLGCQKAQESAVQKPEATQPQESAAATSATSRRITEEEAIQIAVAYMTDGRTSVRWTAPHSRASHYERGMWGEERHGSGWSVFLVREPERTGGHCIVYVSDEGEVVAVQGGA